MTQLILIRHGETDYNRELRFQGDSDVPLNAAGIAQAHAVAKALAGETIYKVVSSDLLRARQTADIITQTLQQPPVKGQATEPNWRERSFGQLDGMRAQDIQSQYPNEWAQWLQYGIDDNTAGMESTRSLHGRVMKAAQLHAFEGCNNNVVVVTHGGVLDMIYRQAQGLPLEGPRQCDIPNAGINRVALHCPNWGRWELVILEWAKTTHLHGLPAQAVYDKAPSA
ncbi:MAG: histidine phosphatase family protein [Burkholderiales bacterium]